MKNELHSKIMSGHTYKPASEDDKFRPHLRIRLRSRLRVTVKDRPAK